MPERAPLRLNINKSVEKELSPDEQIDQLLARAAALDKSAAENLEQHSHYRGGFEDGHLTPDEIIQEENRALSDAYWNGRDANALRAQAEAMRKKQ